MSKILITGGTGSFGSAMVHRILGRNKNLSSVVVFSLDEKKQHDMRQKLNELPVEFIVGDVRDRETLRTAMRDVDYVFHAAALKQVPTGEFFPMELIRTNILGTNNVFEVADEMKVKKVVLLSTDKAVYPVNAMGMTKALAEKLVVAKSKTAQHTTFCAVRYGNVLTSRGSVVPLFIDQIKAGKNITVTDPSMTRFHLTLNDALDLVDFALANGDSGDIFIKKSPASTIHDLAEALQNIFKNQSKIEILGVREGEKWHETLASSIELKHAIDEHDFYRIVNKGTRYSEYFFRGEQVNEVQDYTSQNTKQLSREELIKLLLSTDYVKQEAAAYLKSEKNKS